MNWLTVATRKRLITMLVLLALILPVLRNIDSHPLSTYPMYARQRDSTVSFVVASGVAADGTLWPVSLDLVSGTDDPLIAAARLRAALDLDGGEELCGLIADRSSQFEAIEIATEHHDVIARVSGEASLRSRTVEVRCTR